MKLTAKQFETLVLIRDGGVKSINTGYGSWRIFGASPTVVGRLISLKLAAYGPYIGREQAIGLTHAGVTALSEAQEGRKP